MRTRAALFVWQKSLNMSLLSHSSLIKVIIGKSIAEAVLVTAIAVAFYYSVTNPRDASLAPPSLRPQLPFEQVF